MMDFEQRTPNELMSSVDAGCGTASAATAAAMKSCCALYSTSNSATYDEAAAAAASRTVVADRMDTDGVTATTDSLDGSQSSSDVDRRTVDMDATTTVYLRNAYAQLHENRHRKMNRLFTSADQDRSRGAPPTPTTTTTLSDDEDDGRDSVDCDISVLAKNVANFGIGHHRRTKPIITFTPVHSIEERESDFVPPPISSSSPPSSLSSSTSSSLTWPSPSPPPPPSPILERASSSGSSSPLLEVPAPSINDLALEMMRPPLNN